MIVGRRIGGAYKEERGASGLHGYIWTNWPFEGMPFATTSRIPVKPSGTLGQSNSVETVRLPVATPSLKPWVRQ